MSETDLPIPDAAHAAPGGYADIRGTHGRPGLSKSQLRRPWPQITGITLHQTACLIGERDGIWAGVHAHLGITRAGKIVHLYDFADRVNHGHSFNAGDVGIEIDGHFAGVEGDIRTYWRPAGDPGRMPLVATEDQILAARSAVRAIVEAVAGQGGEVRFIHAHRQSSNQRQSDPGSQIWRDVGLWAQDEFGLSDGGPGFVLPGDGGVPGLPIPEAWDPRYAGVKY
jgi:hypothetical protein